MDKFKELEIACKEMGETNDCSVKALAVVADVDYGTAHAALKAAGRIDRKGYRPEKVIDQFGLYWQKLFFESKTVRTLERELAAKWGGIKILIYQRNEHHVLAWDGKMIQDWSGGRIKRVQYGYIVYPQDQPQPTRGTSVPVPVRKEMRGRKGHTRTGVLVNCEALGIVDAPYSSVAAAYRGLKLNLKGHQKVRRILKARGDVQAQCWQSTGSHQWKTIWITLKVAE